jgi:molecular chaperone GrpE (heat shock protein)
MNGLSRKLRELEDNLLEFPPDDETILMFIGDADEQTLHDKAEMIRETLRPRAKAIISDTTLTLEEQEQASKALLAELDNYQKAVLEESSRFIEYRLRQLVCKYFEAAYPEERDTRVQLRVLWFFEEMQKFNELNKLEDWAFEHNRNEEAPGFDDFRWWEDMEAEKLRRYPEGNFTAESYEKLEAEYDVHMAQKIREYWERHPKEFEELKKRSEPQKRG